MANSRFTNLDLVNNVDHFPDPQREPENYAEMMKGFYAVVWRNGEDDDGEGAFLGYMRRDVYARLESVPKELRCGIVLDPEKDTVSLFHQHPASSHDERTMAIAALSHHLREKDAFEILRGWRAELWPVYGPNGDDDLLFSMERVALSLLGTMRFGIHMTAYVTNPEDGSIKVWVPKRAADKSSFPGMLDNTVAGGLMTNEDPFECMVREADEEASLPEDVVRRHAKAVGTISYIYITDARTGEAGYAYPECQWVYDLQLPEDVVPAPKDGEVESFSLCSIPQIMEDMALGLFKPNCAAIMLDFFIRHGFVTRESEPHLDEILGKLHRILPFPGPHQKEARFQAGSV